MPKTAVFRVGTSNKMDMRKVLTILSILTILIGKANAQEGEFREGLFRYAMFGHSLLSDMHPDFIRFDMAGITNHPEWDWGQTGKRMRVNIFGWYGFSLPLWSSSHNNGSYDVSVSIPAAASCWLDIFEPVTAPVVNTDWRVGLPSVAIIRRTQTKVLRNYLISFSPFKHESTHVGDEILLQRVDYGISLRRVNVSYNYMELSIVLNDPDGILERCQTVKSGLMILWKPKSGWYFIDTTDGDASLAQPIISPWEAYLQYQYQSKFSRRGTQAVASVEIRNRELYGYPVFNRDAGLTLQSEGRIFTFNILIGLRFCQSRTTEAFSRATVGIRAYHGNNPHGMFRNHKDFNQIGICLIIE